MITRRLVQLVACIVMSGIQPPPSDGQANIDDLFAALAAVAREAVLAGPIAEAVAVCEVVGVQSHASASCSFKSNSDSQTCTLP